MDKAQHDEWGTGVTSNVWEQVRGMASDLFGIPTNQITMASSPESIEAWDSVQHLNLVLALEQKFNLQLSPQEIEQMKNMGDIARLVEGKLQATPS
jgi:acyl carrier protein